MKGGSSYSMAKTRGRPDRGVALAALRQSPPEVRAASGRKTATSLSPRSSPESLSVLILSVLSGTLGTVSLGKRSRPLEDLQPPPCRTRLAYGLISQRLL